MVLTARFLRFRGRFPGVGGRGNSAAGAFGGVRDVTSDLAVLNGTTETEMGDGKDLVIGDSGELPGDISVALESSTMDAVVVGEELAEFVADVATNVVGGAWNVSTCFLQIMYFLEASLCRSGSEDRSGSSEPSTAGMAILRLERGLEHARMEMKVCGSRIVETGVDVRVNNLRRFGSV